MATLDVERVIRSPLFTSPCKLIHFVEGLDKFGNPTWTEGESTEVMAVITADTKTISRLPEALRRGHDLSALHDCRYARGFRRLRKR